MSVNNREFTRFDFKPGMWLKIVRPGQNLSDFKMFQLIDISQGGISFKIHSADEFKRGQEFYILEVEAAVLSEPLKGTVRYVKALDEFGVDFKVGVEFIDRF